jgi:hypothetical protein
VGPAGAGGFLIAADAINRIRDTEQDGSRGAERKSVYDTDQSGSKLIKRSGAWVLCSFYLR